MSLEPKLAIYFDGSETPTFRVPINDMLRPPCQDMSWRIVDERTGQTVDEYHPPRTKPRPVVWPVLIKEKA